MGGTIPMSRILRDITDERKAQKKIAICGPVGDQNQLSAFQEYVLKMGFDKEADFVLVCRDGIKQARGLPAVHAYEKFPIGTSGAFFAAQELGYKLGYEFIIVTDIDAFLDSRETLEAMLELAKTTGKCVVPFSRFDKTSSGKTFSVNHWMVFPRKCFETVGFSNPYFFKGGEDYELLCRYRKNNAILLFEKGAAFHPISGHSIYHQMQNKNKFYPYLGSFLKSLLIARNYEKMAILKYIFWYGFFSYFSDVFSDASLLQSVQNCWRLEVPRLREGKGNPLKVKIEQTENEATFHGASFSQIFFIVLSPLTLLVAGQINVYKDRISLDCGRAALFLGILKGILLSPLRFAQAVNAALLWQKESKKMVSPPLAGNLDKVEKGFERMVREGQL